MSEEKKTKRVDSIRRNGLAVTIWERPTIDGVAYSVTMERCYKKDDEFEYTKFIPEEKLLLAAKLLSDAETRISELRANAKSE